MAERFSTENVLSQKLGTKIERRGYQFNQPVNSGQTPTAARSVGRDTTPVGTNMGRDTTPIGTNVGQNRVQANGQTRYNPTSSAGGSFNNSNRSQPALRNGVPRVPEPEPDLDDVDWDDDDFPMDDDDDMLLLSAVENIDPPDPQPIRSAPGPPSRGLENRTQPPPSKPQPVARISPMSVQRPGTKETGAKKTTIQTSIDSFMQNKKPRLELDVPDFDLDDDLEIFDELDVPMETEPQLVSSEPFLYLSFIKQEIKRFPDRRFFVTIKVSYFFYIKKILCQTLDFILQSS